MRIPDESLDDFKVPAVAKLPEPPAPRRVRPSGLIEVVRPLARLENVAEREAAPAGVAAVAPAAPGGSRRLSWLHQSLAVGGALALITFFLVAGLYIGIGDPPSGTGRGESDVAMNRQPEDTQALAAEPSAAELFTDENSPSASDGPFVARSAVRRRHARPRVGYAAYRHRRRPLLLPQFAVSEFVPTTLVIYAENGEIKTRIEPWLAAGFRKPMAFPN